MRMYYWHHFGVAITHPTNSVHTGSIYYRSYKFWSLAQTSQFIEGVAISPDISSQHLEDSPAAAAAENPGEAAPLMRADVTEPEDACPATGSSPHREEPEPELPEIAEDEPEGGDWSGWLSPVQAELLQAEISSHKKELGTLDTQLVQRATSLSISQKMIDDLKATNAIGSASSF